MKKPIELQRDAKFRRAAKNWTKKVAVVPAASDDDHDNGDDHDINGDYYDDTRRRGGTLHPRLVGVMIIMKVRPILIFWIM